MIRTISDGLVYTWRFKLARDVIGMNFVSSFFNSGGWFVAIPFIVTESMKVTRYCSRILPSSFTLVRSSPTLDWSDSCPSSFPGGCISSCNSPG